MHEYEATLVRVIDGDTIVVDIDLGFRVTSRQPVRLYGINTPERGQPGYKDATEALRSLLSAGTFVVRTIKPEDKYGRFLAEIDGVAESMIASGHAVPYFGGAR